VGVRAGQRPGPQHERGGAAQHAEEHDHAEQLSIQPLDRRDQALDKGRRQQDDRADQHRVGGDGRGMVHGQDPLGGQAVQRPE
jgi:hypothetical protein